jgi:hypothetical protein
MSPTPNNSVVTLINVFTVDPANQERLVDLLTRATDGFVSRAQASSPRRSIAASTAQR